MGEARRLVVVRTLVIVAHCEGNLERHAHGAVGLRRHAGKELLHGVVGAVLLDV
jgi:hypothetical protein